MLIDISILIGLILLEMIYVWLYLKWLFGFIGINFFNFVWLFLIVGFFIILLVIIVDCYRVVMFVV